jgi:hypothetical protein
MYKHLAFLLVASGLILARAEKAAAYPEFIGYGYSSCVTCHYNTQGMGPLNDYGRALFAAEISSRALFDDSTTDEQLGESAGFLGKKQLPFWFRPSIKYRGLWFNTDPGSIENRKRFVVMQQDLNLALHDREQRFTFVGNLGWAQRAGAGPYRSEVWLSREHYLRWQMSKEWWLSVGMLDKVFGIRQIDHTAYSREKLGLNNYRTTEYTLTHGAVLQWNQAEREITLHAFMGNYNEQEDLRQKGASVMAEWQTAENSRTGGSLLYSTSENVVQTRYALHQRLGLSHGSALLAEAGYHRDENKNAQTWATGYYAYTQSNILLTRGYNFVSLAEYYMGKTNQGAAPDQFRWGLGFLTFPLPRVEIRLMAIDIRQWSPDKGVKDTWQAQGQLHLSL